MSARTALAPWCWLRSAVLGAAACVLACSSSPAHVHLVDAAFVDADPCNSGDTCNPIEQLGCQGGEKCTWLHVAFGSGECGIIACAPVGTKTLGEQCDFGSPGPSSGYDDCARGLVCEGQRCETICDLSIGSDCSAANTCTMHPDIFFDDGAPQAAAGVCE